MFRKTHHDFFCEVKYANRGIISGSIRIVSEFSDPPYFWDGFFAGIRIWKS